jgi:hypothetical protein
MQTYASPKILLRYRPDANPIPVTQAGRTRWVDSDFHRGAEILRTVTYTDLPGHPKHDRIWQLGRLPDLTAYVACRLARTIQPFYVLYPTPADAAAALDADARRYDADPRWSPTSPHHRPTGSPSASSCTTSPIASNS